MFKIYARRPHFVNRPNGERILHPNSRGIPFGVVVGKPIEDGKIAIGWSQCNPIDRFDKHLGTQMAVGRLEKDPIIIDQNTDPSEINIGNMDFKPRMRNTIQICVEEIRRKPNRYTS